MYMATEASCYVGYIRSKVDSGFIFHVHTLSYLKVLSKRNQLAPFRFQACTRGAAKEHLPSHYQWWLDWCLAEANKKKRANIIEIIFFIIFIIGIQIDRRTDRQSVRQAGWQAIRQPNGGKVSPSVSYMSPVRELH